MNAKEIRQEARQNLKGKWQKGIIISAIYTAIIFVLTLLASKVSRIFSTVELVITPALTYGIAHSYYHLKKGDEVGYVDFLTVGFKNFGRSWQIAWEIIKKTWWCILLAIIPLVIMFAIIGGAIYAGLSTGTLNTKSYLSAYSYGGSARSTYSYDYDSDDYLSSYLDNYSGRTSLSENDVNRILTGMSVGALVGIGIAMIIYVALIIVVAIRMLLYILSYYIAVIKEDIEPKQAVVESQTLMKGNRGRYFCLMLSFFGWFFLVGFVAGLIGIADSEIVTDIVAEVGVAILNPYLAFATIAFYENLSKEKAININEPAAVSENNK